MEGKDDVFKKISNNEVKIRAVPPHIDKITGKIDTKRKFGFILLCDRGLIVRSCYAFHVTGWSWEIALPRPPQVRLVVLHKS